MNKPATSTPLADIRTVSHVAIEVADLSRSLNFYQEVLGFRLIGDFRSDHPQPNVKGLIGDFALEIAELVPEAGQHADALPQRRAAQSLCLSFTVRDLPAAFARCKAAGLVDLDAPSSMKGSSFFPLRDPDGHLIELIELSGGAASLGDLLTQYAAASKAPDSTKDHS
jgi:catechol 2,3-dioxygenase-like lactoylglutathione lyase family enzyme